MPYRTVSFYVELDYNFDGTFTDETDRVISFNVERSISGIGNPFLGSSGRIDRAVVNLQNVDRRYSSKVTTGALYSLIANGKLFHVPIRIGINTGGSDYRIFTGICKLPVEPNGTSKVGKSIQITAYSNEEKYINSKISLTTTKLQEWFTSNPTEDTALDYVLTLIGESGYTLDPGLYNILPYYNDRSAMAVLWDIAKSAGGFLFTDRLGEFKYYNAAHFSGSTSLGIFDRDDFGLVNMSYPDINLAKKVTVVGNFYKLGTDGTLFEAENTYTILPNGNLDIEFDLADPAYSIGSITYDALSLSGTDISADISLSYDFTVEKAILSFVSTNAGYCIISNLTVTGVPLVTESFKVSKISSDSFWSDRVGSNLETSVNQTYIQSESIATTIAQLILNAQQLPNCALQIQDFIYASPLELLDVITIVDNNLITDATNIAITDLEYSFSSSGARCNIKGIDLTNIYPYLTDGYFILGTNKLGNTDPLKERLFY